LAFDRQHGNIPSLGHRIGVPTLRLPASVLSHREAALAADRSVKLAFHTSDEFGFPLCNILDIQN
jgi:hypothetical protein